jgi:glycosyltransferase involved in cell wall biosynthesis
MRVSFDAGRINERGVAVAVFDYAFHARERLGVEPIILHDARKPPNPAHLARFAATFPTFAYESEDEILRLIERERIDVAYFLKTRRGDVRVARSCLTAVHEVFRFFDPHGDSYAYISRSLSETMTGGRYPWVPHIVDPPPPRANLRAALGIPADAFVVGRHGAPDQFNLALAPRAIQAALDRRKNLWILLLNTQRFAEHERIVHLPMTPDRQGVVDFIASCDVGLNARFAGENFGLAIAEFLAQDKPVLVWAGGRDRNHLALVDDPRFVYRTSADLTRQLCELEPRNWGGAWSARVAPFAPASVMATFAKTFLQPEAQAFPRLPPGFNLMRSGLARVRRQRDRLWCAL